MTGRVLYRRCGPTAAILGGAIALALGSACAQGPPPTAALPPGKPMTTTLQSISAAARSDALHRTGLADAQVRVVSAEPVTWRDGSLGCPQPGMAYTEALVPGYRIRVLAGDQELDYHASAGGQLVLCPAGRAVDPLPSSAI